MKLIQWTLFIDMLGYSDINGSIDSDDKAKDFISFMSNNKLLLEMVDDSVESRIRFAKDTVFNLYKYYDIKKAFVSDSLIITYIPKHVNEPELPGLVEMHSANTLFIILGRLNLFIRNCLEKKNIFLRGGISNKYCYVKDNFAVGEGLIEAYLAESKLAVNPRIILHPEVTKNSLLMEKLSFLANEIYNGNSIIKEDSDSLYFLDYLGYVISFADASIPMIEKAAGKNLGQFFINKQEATNFSKKHAEVIAKKLRELNQRLEQEERAHPDRVEKTKSIISKFEWLKNYHNSKLDGHDFLKEHIIN